ncbi:DUF6907 domain-containing protein [Nocardia sp. XZ_19_385]|uniref:DUF6907 domain-containing protein n=1 Tax=Nocardia sp. XZ_19_385 TaxID=2769488 RepID=UPI001890905D|nr:hypothetical protein [Nocardia sp. XZ_19_385]
MDTSTQREHILAFVCPDWCDGGHQPDDPYVRCLDDVLHVGSGTSVSIPWTYGDKSITMEIALACNITADGWPKAPRIDVDVTGCAQSGSVTTAAEAIRLAFELRMMAARVETWVSELP